MRNGEASARILVAPKGAFAGIPIIAPPVIEQISTGVPRPGDYDDPNADAQRQEQAKLALKEERLRSVEESILASPVGREWLWGLLERLHTFEDRIAMSADGYEQGWLNREQALGQSFVRRFAKVSPENFGLMLREFDV